MPHMDAPPPPSQVTQPPPLPAPCAPFAAYGRTRTASPPAADSPAPAPPEHSVDSILLAIPDRAATASAPPDLEISSRSLFAFKAGYSGIFSDIRQDDYYESFYNENPERLNLPPPLPADEFLQQRAADLPYAADDHDHPSLAAQRKAAAASARRPPQQPLDRRYARRTHAENGDAVGAAEVAAHHDGESRDDATASLDQFRAPPVNGEHPRTHFHAHPPPAPPPPAPSTRTRPRADVPPPNSAPAMPRPSRFAQTRQAAQGAANSHDGLWPALHQLTLDDADTTTPHSPQRMYPNASTYAAQNPLRTPYDAGYVYPQPGSPLEAPPLFDSPSQSHWSRALPDLYEQVRYDAMVPPSPRPPSDYASDDIAYSSRNMYAQHSNGSRRAASTRGNGRARGTHYAYMYASRGLVPPAPSNYLDAQAAAAAAAAAAAVYKNGGVHINGTGTFGSTTGGANGRIPRKTRPNGGSSRIGSEYARARVDFQDDGVDLENGGSGANGGGNANGGGGGGARRSLGATKLSSFTDIVGRAEELARDQHGCRFLQTKLEEGNVVYINSIFEECYDKFVELMTDPFGNYLCQKLFEHCNDSQRLALVERCAPAFPRVSTNMHGTRAVQRMVECLSTPRQVEAVCKALAPAAVALMKDINGNHVIQRCLHRMDPAHNQFVYDAVAHNCFELATHRHGCCVMQRCMDYASPAQRNQLATQINANALPLVQNAFGNYVVQYVLGLNDAVYTAEIIRRLRGHVAELSMQKFSSNVVEKGLVQGSRELRRHLVDELIEHADTMRRLLHDAYGNYVIQRALQVAESPQLEQICEAIRPHLNSLRQSPYGKRIQAKIQKRMPKCLPTSVASS